MFGDPVENPHGWLTKGLMELGSCKNGMNFGAKDIGVTIKSVGVGDIKDYDNIEDIESLTTISLNEMPSEEYMLKDGDLVFVRSNGNKELVGRCVAVYPHETPVSFSGFCIRFRKESSDVLLEYLLRYLKMPEVRAKMAGRGANIQNLNQKILAALQVPVPPLETQMAYVAFVRQSDKSKFSCLKSQFIEMFGELDKNTKQLPVRKLSEISSYWNGLTYKPADAVEEGTGTLVLRSSNIQNGALAFDDNVYVNCTIKEKLFVQDNDILMCSRNGSAALVGKTALIKNLKKPTTFGAFMMIIRSEYYSYLKTYFEMPYFRSQISTGTSTINQITGKMLNEILLPVPDMDTVRKFEAFVNQSDKSK